jgi:F-type H+-transporting ATPase subunit b
MISDLLLLAEATGHEAAAHAEASGVTKIFNDFGIDVPFFLAQALNFAVVATLLWFFAFKPVLATLEQRRKQIDQGLKDAEATKIKLADAQAESTRLLQKAQVEAGDIIESARKASKELADREAAAATERANELITKAQQAIQLEHKKMMDEARGEIARLVVTTTQRVLAKELSDTERSRFNDAASKELANV